MAISDITPTPMPDFGPKPHTDGEWNGFISKLSGGFDDNVSKLNTSLKTAIEQLTSDPTDPSLLAKVQSTLSEYTIYRNAQSNVAKSFKDTASGIVQNFR